MITQISSAATGNNVNALSWAPSGTYVAVGKNDNTAEVTVYPVSAGGVLGTAVNYNITPNATVQRTAIAWDKTGSYLAVGTATSPQLRLLYYNGTTLTPQQTIAVGQTVQTLAWSHDGALLAAGLAGGTNRFSMYSFNGSTLTAVPSYNNGETLTVNSISWDSDDTDLV